MTRELLMQYLALFTFGLCALLMLLLVAGAAVQVWAGRR